MSTDKILIPSIVGTTAMTVFSYLVSEAKNKNFREPDVLAQLIERLPIIHSEENSQIAGWGMHYAIGLLFVALYYELWKRNKVQPSLASGTLLGAASGLVGIASWKIMFESHPNAPAKNLKTYFGHLMLAHIVFGVFSTIAYDLMDTDKDLKL